MSRKPPIKRTFDSFQDDANSQENPRIDFGDARHTQVRRDKDTVRPIAITLQDIDFAVASYIKNVMKIRVEDSKEFIDVPVLYANSEKWAFVQRHGYLKDVKGKTFAPLITFRRTSVMIKQEMKKNKVATINQMGYVSGRRYHQRHPYDKFSLLNGTTPQLEYYLTPIPDYVDLSYDFFVWTEYIPQLNHILEQFVHYCGKSFGDRNWLKFATNVENFTTEDTNVTGEDRLVKANFQLTVHGHLIPKETAAEVTTKRLITPRKVHFISEAFLPDAKSLEQRFRELNYDESEEAADLQRINDDFINTTINGSPGVYPVED